MLGRSGFGDAVGSVEAAASDDIQEITFLGSCLMWNDAAVCCGKIWLKMFVRVCVGLTRCVLDDFYFWYCVEGVFICHEGTDAFAVRR